MKQKTQGAEAKKQIIAKKMGGNANRPNSWSKTVEGRNKEKEIDEDMFTKKDRSTEKKAFSQKGDDQRDNGGKNQFLN